MALYALNKYTVSSVFPACTRGAATIGRLVLFAFETPLLELTPGFDSFIMASNSPST